MRRMGAAAAAFGMVLGSLGPGGFRPAGAVSPADRYHGFLGPQQPAVAYPAGSPNLVDASHPATVTNPVSLVPSDPPLVPPGATAVMLRFRVDTPGLAQIVMVHPCSRPGDPLTDIVVRIRVNEELPTAQVLAPWNGSTCISSDADGRPAQISAPEILGYVDGDPGGASWVDLPDHTVLRSGTHPAASAADVDAAGVPADAAAVALWIFGTTAAPGHLSGCGGLVDVIGQGRIIQTSLWVSRLDAACLTTDLTTGTTDLTVQIAGYYAVGATPSPLGPPQIRFRPTAAPLFNPIAPRRLFDTRDAGARLPADDTFALPLPDLPRATAVSLNVTVTDPTGAGFVTVWPCSSPRPLASSLNFTPGQTVANAVIVSTGDDGHVCFSSHAPTHLVADLAGWFEVERGAGYVPRPPVRAFDTRATRTPVAAGVAHEEDLSAIVPADATAVVLNVTATDPLSDGFISAYPCGESPPLASSLNVTRGTTIANLVTVAIPADGRICFFTNVTTNLIGDVSGWFATSSRAGFVDIAPSRLFDTREGESTPQGPGAESFVRFASNQDAWVMNVTAAAATGAGFVTVYPCGDRPTASNLNYVAGQTVPNLVIAAPSTTAEVCFYTHGRTHLLADLQGWFTSRTFYVAVEPDGFDHG